MATIYLHIGFEKTGSTYIQESIGRNINFLKKNNIVVPTFFFKRSNMSELVSCFVPKDACVNMKCTNDKNEFMKKFLAFLYENKNNSILISSEHFSSRLTERFEMKSLRDFLVTHGHEVKVVCFYREPRSWAESRYSQYVKSGGCLKSADFFGSKGSLLESIRRSVIYLDVLQKWKKVFGKNFICFDYDQLKHDSELMKVFLNSIGIHKSQNFCEASYQQSNPTLLNKQIKILRWLNHISNSFFLRRVIIRFFGFVNNVFHLKKDGDLVDSFVIKSFEKRNQSALKFYFEN